jgi:hypothetical protein
VNYNIFRWYRESWGRYTQPDPAWVGGRFEELAHYTYTGADPIDNADPAGLFRTGDVLCRRTAGSKVWEDVSLVVKDDNGPTNTVLNKGVQVATFNRLDQVKKLKPPLDAACPKGIKGIGPATSQYDMYPGLTEVKRSDSSANDVTEQEIVDRWKRWNDCYGKPGQRSDFVYFLATGKRKWLGLGSSSIDDYCK